MNLDKYIGVPFVDKETDCINLLRKYYREQLNIQLPVMDSSAYDAKRAFSVYLLQIQKNWVKLDKPEIFSIIAMASLPEHPKIINHFGMYIGNNKMLHTLDKVGSHIIEMKYYQSFIKGFYKWQPNQ